jgi:hypothetical protein
MVTINHNIILIKKSIPYPIYTTKTNFNVHNESFLNGYSSQSRKERFDMVNMLCFTLWDAI